MKCYKCAKEGKETEAAGMCVVCGMGLCMDHIQMVEVSFWEAQLMHLASVSGLGIDNKVERKVPKILCDECYALTAQGAASENIFTQGA